MVYFDYFKRELTFKIAYYGPKGSGKYTNLNVVYQQTPPIYRSEIHNGTLDENPMFWMDYVSIQAEHLELPKVNLKLKSRLFTLKEEDFQENNSRQLLLKNVDGIIFVAESEPDKFGENVRYWENLKINLEKNGTRESQIVLILQANKQDLPNADSAEKVKNEILSAPYQQENISSEEEISIFEASALNQKGVLDTLENCFQEMYQRFLSNQVF